MFEVFSDSFRSIANKIRFSDDQKALSKAIDELKKAMLRNDVHHKVVKEILQQVEKQTIQEGIGKQNFLKALQDALSGVLQTKGNQGFVFAPTAPTKILMVGLQGSGKTTTTAKLANYLKNKNKKVLLVPCDLQRMAAVEQLRQLAKQIDVDFFESAHKRPQDVAQEALNYSASRFYDVILFDTAGRLAIDEELMEELKEVKDIVKPFEVFDVADSLSGQEGVRNAEMFNQKIGIDGVILSKFDSDSKGGIALSIAYQLGIALRFIGSGEKVADLDIFLPDRVVSRLMGAGDIAGLAEKTAEVFSEKESKNIVKKIKKGQFGFEDFLAQIENVKKLGNLGNLVGMIPGMGGMAGALKNVDLDNSAEIKNIRAMVNSMTKKERENPDLLNGSRRKRIALGCGLEVADINRIIKQFDNASKMAKRLGNKGGMQDLMGMMQQMRMNGRFPK
ncbi:signal recognition particle protein [Helicobacter enhydrae]|uniref:signal-recognition-particle GTPase n=1 Tax=Helicobacter enhydrae TaxID=222136 RepID=A0A1B1U5U3_9HELI|nr:signal recognition particle protein [Helicobacter enhydrae]ANV98120.1 signal recognition particle protein [Helicobacter enhydrae]